MTTWLSNSLSLYCFVNLNSFKFLKLFGSVAITNNERHLSIFMLQEKRKAEREESKKARAEAKAKARAERQKTKDAATKEPTISSPEVTSSTVLAKPDRGIDSLSVSSVASVEVVYQQGLAGTGQPYVEYPQVDLDFYALFALGSPIGMFQTVRYESLVRLLAYMCSCSYFMVQSCVQWYDG